MITEDYVSFEVAKLLKKRGFNEECEYFYDEYNDNEYVICSNGVSAYNDDEHPTYYSMPTLQMAMKWLREVYKLEITPFHEMFQGNSWWYRIERNTSLSLVVEYEEDCIYGSYEQACEAAIKYCLELI